MPGTKAGGKKAAITNKLRHGEEFYAKIGRMGGRNGHSGGFSIPGLARKAGKKGGTISRRGIAKDNKNILDENRATIVSMYYQRKTIKEIAAAIGISYAVLLRNIEKIIKEEEKKCL